MRAPDVITAELASLDCLAVGRYVVISKAHAPLCTPALANFAKPPCASLVAFVIAHMQSSAELAPVGFLCWLELLTSLATLQAHIPDSNPVGSTSTGELAAKSVS